MYFVNKTKEYVDKQYDKRRNEAQICELCQEELGVLKLNRVHQCKRCMRIICKQCGQQKYKDIITKELRRTCEQCVTEITNMEVFCQQNNIKWNSDSKFSKNWIKQIPHQEIIDENDYTYFYKQFEKNYNHFENENYVINCDVSQGRTDYQVYNYSLKHFIYYVQTTEQQYDLIIYRKNMINILRAFVYRNPKIGYCQGMNSIVCFLLCFCSEINAFILFNHMINNIFPKNCFQNSDMGTGLIGYKKQEFVILEYLKMILEKELQLQNDEIQNVISFAVTRIPHMIFNLLMNSLNYSTQILLWNQAIIDENFDIIQNSIVSIILMSVDILKNHQKMSSQDITNQIILNVEYNDLLKIIYKQKISQNQKKIFEDQFDEDNLLKWEQSNSNVHYNLSKCTNFSKNEIQLIQEKFIQFIQQNKSKGINKEQFLLIINQFKSMNILSDKFNHDNQKYEELFSYFNDNESGIMDFRQFICFVSFASRGTIKQKLQLNFEIIDKKNKGFIDINQFEQLLEQLIKSVINSKVQIQTDYLEEFELQVQKFKLRSLDQNKLKYISLLEVLNIQDDPFLIDLKNYMEKEKSLTRTETHLYLAEGLQNAQQKNNQQ